MSAKRGKRGKDQTDRADQTDPTDLRKKISHTVAGRGADETARGSLAGSGKARPSQQTTVPAEMLGADGGPSGDEPGGGGSGAATSAVTVTPDNPTPNGAQSADPGDPVSGGTDETAMNGGRVPLRAPGASGAIADGRWANADCSEGSAGASPYLQISKASPLSLLLPYQARWVSDGSRFKIGVWARQTGKSFACAGEAVRDARVTPKTEWVVLSAGERQALEFMRKAREWSEAFDLAEADYRETRDGAETVLKSAEIVWGNGSRMLALPANPDTARGYSANLILDEFAFHERPDEIWRAIYPSISNPLKGVKRIRIVSTPNGKANKFHSLWETQNKWSKHKVSIEDAVAQGLPINIEELRAGLDDPEGWAQEYECLFVDTSNVLLPYDLIAGCESADASEVGHVLMTSRTRLVCGIDFGRTTDPTVCWTLEQIGDVLWTREVLVLKDTSTPDQEAILRSRVERAGRVCLDYTGPGIGLGDYLARSYGRYEPKEHSFGRMELCVFNRGFKREIFPLMRRRFEERRLRVPISTAVREDLHAMQQIVQGGEYNYWAPRGPEGHSDRCTALALAVRAAGTGLGDGTVRSVDGIMVGGTERGGSGRRMFRPRVWYPGRDRETEGVA